MTKFIACLAVVAIAVAGCDTRISIRPTADGYEFTAVSNSTPPSEPVGDADSVPATIKPAEPPQPAPTPPRPAWVGAPAGLHNGVYETAVVVGPERNREACEAKLAPAVEAAVERYARNQYGDAAREQLNLSYASLSKDIVGPNWEERVTVDGEEAVFLHTQVRFDDHLRGEWRREIDRWITALRTFEVVRNFAAAMAGVLVVHLLLRFGPRKTSAA